MEKHVPGAGLVYLCNPNNPTATVLSASAVTAFIERVARLSPQTMVLVDEAYQEYVDDAAYRTSIPLTAARRNVIVSRTFSKLHGLAGLRCGYGVAHPETISQMERFKLETSVNQIAAAGARAALADNERIQQERAINRDVRESARRLFVSLGFAPGPSETNFLWIDLRRDSAAFRAGCRRAGVIVGRGFPPLSNHVRISIGTMEEMTRAGTVFTRLLRG
jgi:histidinol-phosphate aminotransferase